MFHSGHCCRSHTQLFLLIRDKSKSISDIVVTSFKSNKDLTNPLDFEKKSSNCNATNISHITFRLILVLRITCQISMPQKIMLVNITIVTLQFDDFLPMHSNRIFGSRFFLFYDCKATLQRPSVIKENASICCLCT